MSKRINQIKNLFHLSSLLDSQSNYLNDLILESEKRIIEANAFEIRKSYLHDMTLHSSESGVSDKKYCDNEVIVSMATHDIRIQEAYLAIESVMQQTMKPNRIILNISQEEFRNTPLPLMLLKQQSRGLEINYCEDYWSFKKLIPTIRRFPHAIIITLDDDCLYNCDLIENLFNSHLSDPRAIWGNRIHDITFNENGTIKSYMDWNQQIANTDKPSKLHFITTVGGVLYPPNSLYKDITRDDIFMEISKTNDDVWCYAMAILNGTPIKKVLTRSPVGDEYLSIADVQFLGLANDNTNIGSHFCRNDVTIKQVFDRYDIYKIICE